MITTFLDRRLAPRLRGALLAPFLFALLALISDVQAQPFTELTTLPGAWWGDTAWADIDGDGDLDLVVTGVTTTNIGDVYRNDGFGGLTRDVTASNEISNLTYSAAAWGDYDGDGDPDLIISGYSFSNSESLVYRNDGTGAFTFDAAASTVVRNTFYGDLAWADIDGDDDLDLAVIGFDNAGDVYRNDGTGGLTFDAAASAVIPDLFNSTFDWGDMDGDGDLDLAVLGVGGGVATGNVYRNDGTGGFTLDAAASAVLVGNSSVWPDIAWVDVDGDGDLDLAAAVGGGPSGRISEIYRNDGTGVLTRDATASAAIGDFSEPRMAWGDPDGDGDQDLMITGSSGTPVTHFYRNDGTGAFTRDTAIDSGFPGLGAASMNWVDVDGDGDLDLEMQGYSSTTGGAYGRIFRNDRLTVPLAITPLSGRGGEPIEAPVVIPPTSTKVFYEARATNRSASVVTTSIWSSVTLPSGTVITQRRTTALEIPATSTAAWAGTVNFNAALPTGTYTVTAYVGTHPSGVIGLKAFDVIKAVPTRSGEPILTEAQILAMDPDVLFFGAEASTVDTVPDSPETPTTTALGAAYPNPFNPTATVPFTLAQDGDVRLAVYDALGREVAVLAQGRMAAGSHTAFFDGTSLPSGTYLVRLTAGTQIQTQRVTLLK